MAVKQKLKDGNDGARIAVVPTNASLLELKIAAEKCTGCDLYKFATQVVFGEGHSSARAIFIGEQPGNEEDLQGRPFVGPAGGILNRALVDAGIKREDAYVTNAVKHFKFEERGKRRLHKKPRISEVRACKPWLEAEVHRIRPAVLVCLGSTAAQSLFGPAFRLMASRGKWIEHPWAPRVMATIHPSAILRAPTSEDRHSQYASFVSDLQLVRNVLANHSR